MDWDLLVDKVSFIPYFVYHIMWQIFLKHVKGIYNKPANIIDLSKQYTFLSFFKLLCQQEGQKLYVFQL